MSLFTDGSIATLQDLKAYESSVLDVASTEKIDLTAKLAVAQREIGLEVTAFLLRNGAGTGSARTLSQVVVTEPLLHLHVLQTLAATYRDAYNSQLNDRYGGKWKEYVRLSNRALDLLFDIGVGITYKPVAKAARPSLTAVPGGLLPASTYCVQIAWCGSDGRTGAWSEPVFQSCDPGQLLVVTPSRAPSGVGGYVIYAGLDDHSMRRQVEVPLGPNTAWTMSETGLRTDFADLPVQGPESYCANGRGLLRG